MAVKKPKSPVEIAELKFRSLLDRRDESNNAAKLIRDERDVLHEQKSTVLAEIQGIKLQRNKIVEVMRGHKLKRNLLQKRAKELIDFRKKSRSKTVKSAARRVEELQKKIENLQRVQETTALTLAKENALLADLKKTRKEMEETLKAREQEDQILKEVKEFDLAITALFKEADEEHQKVLELSKVAEELRVKMDDLFMGTSHLIVEANKKHQEYLKMRGRADDYHQKAAEMRTKVLVARKEQDSERVEARQLLREQNRAVRKIFEDPAMLDRKAEEQVQELLRKGKLEIR